VNIDSLTLNTHDIDGLYAFYVEKWGFPLLEKSAERLSIRIGASTLTFVRDMTRQWRYHFAFNILPPHMEQAEAWLKSHTDLITYNDNALIEQSPLWEATSLYYRDPAGNIGELIARRRLADNGASHFDVTQIQNICEIGIPSHDVLSLVAEYNALGIPAFGSGGDTFSAVGDDNGLVIVVKWGRIWFPNTGIPADCLPLALIIDGKTFLT
jgi:catechol-2,3-dioxygenase